MIKEEWRIHSRLFGSFMFFMFPILLIAIIFAGSLTLPIFRQIIPVNQLLIILHYAFIIFGLSIGSFGLLGREVMNRRFGQASLIAYSSRTLPVSERRIFLNFIVKDIIYYFSLWILPFALGFALASPFLSISLAYPASLLLTLTLSFLMGLSIVFFFSTIYVHSSKALIAILALFIASLMLSVTYLNMDLSSLLTFTFFPSIGKVIASLFIIIIPSIFSLVFLKVDYPQKKRFFKNSLERLSKLFRFSGYSTFMSKDFLDFKRSEGGLGKIIFSFLFPMAVAWLLLVIFLKFVPILNFFVIFSIFLGIISSSFYNWLTEFDLFTSYSFLPVKVSTIIKGKINSYVIINSISVIILFLVAFLSNQSVYLLPSLTAFLAISAYTLSITIYLAGLTPNIFLYNAKIFAEYLLLISPILLVLIFLSIPSPFYLVSSFLLIPISNRVIKASYDKWDRIEQLGFY
jgi:hypothetical protein